MKENRLKIIVGLMTFAVIGLIGVQIYWLANLIKVEEEKFDRTVINSLTRVASKLEKEEAVKTIFKKIITDGKRNDNLKKHKTITVTSGNFGVLAQDTLAGAHFVRMVDDDNDIRWEYKTDSTERINSAHLKFINVPPNKISGAKISQSVFFTNHKIDTLIRSKKKLVQNVVTEMIHVKMMQPIENRIDKKELEKSLVKEFSNRGINGEFYFGINKVPKDSLALVKKGADIKKLKHSDYRTLLFPEELFTGPNELIVYFPNKNSYILSSVAGMLGLSIGFILLIVVVFYKTVQMFLRQKKITEVKNDLINNITHEFKTPISTISLACEALNEPVLTAEKQSIIRYSKIIKEENDRLQMMVDTLLNTAALERDELEIAREEVSIEQIITPVIIKFDETLKQRDGVISFENKAANRKVIGDIFHLTNVISNLIDNAIKYNERKPVINIFTQNTQTGIDISITDNGIGIPAESIKKIFETFYRVQKGNIQNFRGNGIGLSYSKKIIELHRGTIDVKSETGIGSTFTINLPAI